MIIKEAEKPFLWSNIVPQPQAPKKILLSSKTVSLHYKVRGEGTWVPADEYFKDMLCKRSPMALSSKSTWEFVRGHEVMSTLEVLPEKSSTKKWHYIIYFFFTAFFSFTNCSSGLCRVVPLTTIKPFFPPTKRSFTHTQYHFQPTVYQFFVLTVSKMSRLSRATIKARESVFASGPEHYIGDIQARCPPDLDECVLAMEDCCEEVLHGFRTFLSLFDSCHLSSYTKHRPCFAMERTIFLEWPRFCKTRG